MLTESEFKKLISVYHKNVLEDKQFYQSGNNLYWEHGKKEYASYDLKKKEFTLLIKMNVNSEQEFKLLIAPWKTLSPYTEEVKVSSGSYFWQSCPRGTSIYYSIHHRECMFVLCEYELSKYLNNQPSAPSAS